MLYYVKSLGVLEWTGNVGQDVIDIARKSGLDLKLNTDWWERAARQATEDDVRVALRYGIPAADGIVVAAGHIVTVHRPVELAEMAVRNTARTAAYRADPQTQAVEAWREQLAPGSRDASRKIDEGVAGSLANAIYEAKKDASAELALQPAEGLVAHWENLPGARLPSPL